jgi:hypothetical protein
MVGFAEVNMADMHVIVLVIGMETCVNTQKLTELDRPVPCVSYVPSFSGLFSCDCPFGFR